MFPISVASTTFPKNHSVYKFDKKKWWKKDLLKQAIHSILICSLIQIVQIRRRNGYFFQPISLVNTFSQVNRFVIDNSFHLRLFFFYFSNRCWNGKLLNKSPIACRVKEKIFHRRLSDNDRLVQFKSGMGRNDNAKYFLNR